MKTSLSVIIPAYNEEKNIEKTIKSALSVIPKYTASYEIIVINDASKDKTLQIVRKLAQKYKGVRLLNNETNLGFGGSYWKGVQNAKKEYTMLLWGDNAHTEQSLHKIWENLGKYDVVIPNYTNVNTRTFTRRTISKVFTMIVNFITGFSIRYYNGSTLYRTKLIRSLPRKSTGFSFQAEALAYLLLQGASYKQVDVLRRNKPDGKTTAFKLKNFTSVAKSLKWMSELRLKSLTKG